jgi:hypothetical protein
VAYIAAETKQDEDIWIFDQTILMVVMIHKACGVEMHAH